MAVIYFDRTQDFRTTTFATLTDVDNKHLKRGNGTWWSQLDKAVIPHYIDSFEILPGHHTIEVEVCFRVETNYSTRPATRTIDVEAGKTYSLTPGYKVGPVIARSKTPILGGVKWTTTYAGVDIWIDFWESNPIRPPHVVVWPKAPPSARADQFGQPNPSERQALKGNKSDAQQFPLFKPQAIVDAVVTVEIKGWQQPHGPSFGVFGEGMSVFMLKRRNNDFIASSVIPSADGKTFTKGVLMVQTTLGVSMSARPITSPTLSGAVWTPRASALGKLDLRGNNKITANPDFNFDAFKNSPSVIPFSNGYAVNLFGQKIGEWGVVDTNTPPKGNYVSDDGSPLYGRLVRGSSRGLEEIILAPPTP